VKVKITTETEIEMDLDVMAKAFAHLNDDEQAKFFVKVAEIGKTFGGFGPEYQWYQIGSHLRNCECSTEAAREMIRHMHIGLEEGTH